MLKTHLKQLIIKKTLKCFINMRLIRFVHVISDQSMKLINPMFTTYAQLSTESDSWHTLCIQNGAYRSERECKQPNSDSLTNLLSVASNVCESDKEMYKAFHDMCPVYKHKHYYAVGALEPNPTHCHYTFDVITYDAFFDENDSRYDDYIKKVHEFIDKCEAYQKDNYKLFYEKFC